MSIDPNAIHTVVEGDGERTFLLLNGAGQSLHTWDYVVPALLGSGRVIRFDAPGVGESPPPDAPYSFEELAQSAMELVERHGVGSLVVVGHAWGARAAQVIARDYEIAGVVIGSGGGKFPPRAEPADMRTATEGAQDDDSEDWNQRFERAYCAPGFAERDPERAGWLFRLARSTPCEPSVVAGAMERTPVDSYWGQFDVPALLLYGADDLVGHAENAEDLHRRLPRSKLVFIEQAGHFVISEQPERFAAEVAPQFA
jgi:3-oxoadipate enol-lactonase